MLINLVVIIPAFNEEETICKVIEDIPKINGLNLKIIVIDDGSSDNTISEAKKTSALIIRNNENLGLGVTFKRGLNEALKNGADIIVNLDADNQYNPKYIPHLVNVLQKENVDLVIGNRFLDDKELGHNIIKRLGNKIISVFISKILLRHKEILDIQSGFRVMNKDLAKFLVYNLNGKYTYTQEMMILTALNKFKIEQKFIKFNKRTSGKSRLIKNPFSYLFKILIITLKTFFKAKIKKNIRVN